jgi:hypothetical protein
MGSIYELSGETLDVSVDFDHSFLCEIPLSVS